MIRAKTWINLWILFCDHDLKAMRLDVLYLLNATKSSYALLFILSEIEFILYLVLTQNMLMIHSSQTVLERSFLCLPLELSITFEMT